MQNNVRGELDCDLNFLQEFLAVDGAESHERSSWILSMILQTVQNTESIDIMGSQDTKKHTLALAWSSTAT